MPSSVRVAKDWSVMPGDGFGPRARRWGTSLLAVAAFILAVPLAAVAQSGGNHPPVALPPPAPSTAVAFDAANDGLSRTTNLPSITSYTMMGWFKITGDSNTYSTLMGLSQATSGNAYLVMLCCGNGWDSLALWTGNAFRMGDNLALGTWHHMAITVAGAGRARCSPSDGVLSITADGNPAVTAEPRRLPTTIIPSGRAPTCRP